MLRQKRINKKIKLSDSFDVYKKNLWRVWTKYSWISFLCRYSSGELLGEITLALEMDCDAEDIALTIHAHPTLHESVGMAAEIYEGSITDLPNAKAKKK